MQLHKVGYRAAGDAADDQWGSQAVHWEAEDVYEVEDDEDCGDNIPKHEINPLIC